MNYEKMVTEREAVLRERKAWEAAATWASGAYLAPGRAQLLAREIFPLPKRQRPLRVRLSDDHEWWYNGDGTFSSLGYIAPFALCDIGRFKARTADDFEKIARCLRGELEDLPGDE